MSYVNKNPITRFVVGPIGSAIYQTIQSAIDAADAYGGGAVYIMPGTYTEDLVIPNNIQLVGAVGSSYVTQIPSVIISGTHTPPAAGTFSATSVAFFSSGHIFDSAAAGSTVILLNSCTQACTGYTFNLVNWVGVFVFVNTEDNSADNGIINNTGGALVFLRRTTTGSGSTYPMITSSIVQIQNSTLGCRWTAGSGTVASAIFGTFQREVVLNGDANGSFESCSFMGGSSPAITMSSSTPSIFAQCFIDSSNNPAIAGSGSGTLSLGALAFLTNANIAGTLTVAGIGGFLPGSFGTTGQVLTSNGLGVVPTFQTSPGSLVNINSWVDVNTTLQDILPNTGYSITESGGVILTLPVSASLGSLVIVTGKGAGGWIITQRAGQKIYFGSSSTTTGTSGSIASSLARDVVYLRCVVVDTDWQVETAVGNLSIV